MTATQSTAGKWRPYCSECLGRCTPDTRDYGFDYEGPSGSRSVSDIQEVSDCCEADVVDDNPTCTRCESYLPDTEPVYWTRGVLHCQDCHDGVPLDA
jgi:hypothetical protein